MMNKDTAIANLNSFTNDQIKEFNKHSTVKIYSDKIEEMTADEKNASVDTAEYINTLSQSQIDSDISGYLNGDRKISGWPC